MQKMDIIDNEDWQKFRNGESKALERIYNRHKDNLYTFCLYTLKDRQMSEDVVQETFIKLIEQKEKLPGINSLKNWLFICTRNLTYNLLKEQSYSNSSPVEQVPLESSIEQKLFVKKILNQLDAEERDLILLREHQQFSISEIASMLQISEEAVRVRLYRIRKKMNKLGKA